MKKVALVHFNHRIQDGRVVWPDLAKSRWKPNYGDMLVCAAILRQMSKVESFRIGFGRTSNEQCDIAVVRGSTYLHENFDFVAAINTIKSLDAPVAVVGLGAQAKVKDPRFLDEHEGAKTFIRMIAERSKSIAVRGDFSAEVVRRLGAKDIRVTGCPSLFYHGEAPRPVVPARLTSAERRVGISLHSGLRNSIFCRAPEDARAAHGRLISHALKNAEKVSLFEQGNMDEFNAADPRRSMEDRLESAKIIRERIDQTDQLTPQDIISHLVSVRNIEEWLAEVSRLDAVLGFRFHGNMVGLLQGIPCFYYVYDSRLQEFCELYHLPWKDVEDEWCDPFETILEHDWNEARQAFKACLGELRTFYDENGVPVIL